MVREKYVFVADIHIVLIRAENFMISSTFPPMHLNQISRRLIERGVYNV